MEHQHVDEEALDGTFSGDSRWLETIELTDFRSSVLNFSRLPCDTPGRPDVQRLSLTSLIERVEEQFEAEKQLVIANSDDESVAASKAVETVTVVEYDIDTDEFCFDYPYKCGTMHSRLELFDRRSEECSGLFGVVPGQRVHDSLVGIGATAIGMRVKPDGKLAMWYHVDGAPGAGPFPAGSTLALSGCTVNLTPAVDADSTGTTVTFDDNLPREPLQLDFQYRSELTESELRKPLGSNFEALCTRYFDVRTEICDRFGVVSGQRVRVLGHEATAIGAAPDSGFLKMWYHQDGRYGAGLYPAGTEVRLTNKFVSLLTPHSAAMDRVACEPAYTGEDFIVKDVSVQPLELTAGTEVGTAIELPTSDHQLVVVDLPFDPSVELQQTFCYQTGAQALSGEAMFDVREDVCRGLFGVVPGQRVLSNAGMATAVGMNHLPDGTLAMWYHVDGAPGRARFLLVLRLLCPAVQSILLQLSMVIVPVPPSRSTTTYRASPCNLTFSTVRN